MACKVKRKNRKSLKRTCWLQKLRKMKNRTVKTRKILLNLFPLSN